VADRLEDLLIGTYRPLFEAERSRRDQVRASLAIPMTAMSVVMVGFGILLNNSSWRSDTTLGLALSSIVLFLGSASASLLGVAILKIIVADSPEQRQDPSGLDEIRRFAVDRGRELRTMGGVPVDDTVLREVKGFLAEDYASCYADMVGVNARLLRLRYAALRLMAGSLFMLLLAFVAEGINKHHMIGVPSVSAEVAKTGHASSQSGEGRNGDVEQRH